MPKKPVTDPHKAWNIAHHKRLEAYNKRIEALLNRAIMQSADLAMRHGAKATADTPFSYSQDRQLKAETEQLLRDLSDEITKVTKQAETKEWEQAYKQSIDYLSSVYNVAKQTEAIQALFEERLVGMKARNLDAFRAFQNRKIGGLRLSDKVWDYTKDFEQQMEVSIDQALLEGKSAEALSRDIRSLLKDPDALFRRVRDDNDQLRMSKAMEAYHPGQGRYRSAYKNAMRLARSEINMAYRSSDYQTAQDFDACVGIRVNLSNNHTCNGKPFVDICDQLSNQDYPKYFKFVGWHPQCYSSDSEVYTADGWKFFKDVKDDDLILSLNPETKTIEWTAITDMQCYEHSGTMIHFKGGEIDCLVTPEHRMVFLNHDGDIGYSEAKDFTKSHGSFIIDIDCDLITWSFTKTQVEYSGKVYDLTLAQNHIMYIRRNGKCFWGSNCRCFITYILKTDEEFWRDIEDGVNRESVNTVHDVPDNFKEWVAKNEKRIAKAEERGTLPYFLRDNKEFYSLNTQYMITETEVQRLTKDLDFTISNHTSYSSIVEAYNNSNIRGFNMGEFFDELEQIWGDSGFSIYRRTIGIYNNDVIVEFEGINSAGKKITMYRTFEKAGNKTDVLHELFDIPKDFQGKGLSKKTFAALFKQYDKMDHINCVKMNANLDVGGYAWARYGFATTQDQLDGIFNNYRDTIKALNEKRKKDGQELVKVLDNDELAELRKRFDEIFKEKSFVRGETYKKTYIDMRDLSDVPNAKCLLLGSEWKGVLFYDNDKQLHECHSYFRK